MHLVTGVCLLLFVYWSFRRAKGSSPSQFHKVDYAEILHKYEELLERSAELERKVEAIKANAEITEALYSSAQSRELLAKAMIQRLAKDVGYNAADTRKIIDAIFKC